MANIKIGNKLVNILLGSSQSVTVPTGETWKVNILMGAPQNSILINGSHFVCSQASVGSQAFENIILKSGTVLGAPSNANGHIFISGFVIN